MIEHSVPATETSPELTVDTALRFDTAEEAFMHGYTEHVGAGSKLDGRFGQNPTELQLFAARHGDIALVRRAEALAFFDVFAKPPVAESAIQPSLARRMASALFKRQ